AQPVVNRWWGCSGFMKEISRSNRIKNVVSLQVAREHARQPRGASNRHVSKRSNQRLLERLEAENAQLRGSVVDLMLQLQALRDGASLPPPGSMMTLWPRRGCACQAARRPDPITADMSSSRYGGCFRPTKCQGNRVGGIKGNRTCGTEPCIRRVHCSSVRSPWR